MTVEMLVPGNVKVNYVNMIDKWKNDCAEDAVEWLKAKAGRRTPIKNGEIVAYEEGFKAGWMKAVQTLNLQGVTRIEEVQKKKGWV